MSLSRYYESSTSFQPEEIVKHGGDRKAASGPSPGEEEGGVSGHPLRAGLPAEQAGGAGDAPAEGPLPDPVDLDGTADQMFPAEPPTPATMVDPAGYVELAVVEQQNEEAYRRGFAKGGEEERQKAEDDFAAAGRALLLACQQLDSLRETIIVNSSRELVEFTLAIAEKIVRTSLREQDASIVATIEEALRRAIKSDEFTIFLHPDDYAAVAARSTEIVSGISGLNNITLRKDRTVERGGAKIESDNCTIDATVASQFDLIREEVRKKL